MTVHDEVASFMRDRILDGGPEQAGASMADHVVAERYNISRATARAAIEKLTHAGILVREPNRQAHVARLSAQYVRDLFRVRRPIELEAVRLLTLKGLDVPADAERAVKMLERLDDSDPPHVIIDTNLGFHRALVAGVNNAALVRAYDALEGEVALALSQSRVYELSGGAAADHKKLLKVLRTHDWERARTAVLTHLKASAKEIAARLDESR